MTNLLIYFGIVFLSTVSSRWMYSDYKNEEKTLFRFSHPRATITTPESGSSDRRPTMTTLGNGSSERSKLMSTLEKKSSHRRAWMTT